MSMCALEIDGLGFEMARASNARRAWPSSDRLRLPIINLTEHIYLQDSNQRAIYLCDTMNGHTSPPMTGGKRLRQLLANPSKTVVAPGVHDGITARLALAWGAECLYMVQIL